jgi:DNA-binding GntR family transcriptional regulator
MEQEESTGPRSKKQAPASRRSRRVEKRPVAKSTNQTVRESDSGRMEVSDLLLSELIKNETFLTTPLSEGDTTDALNESLGGTGGQVAKSAVRETIIGFVRTAWLKRTPDGIVRDDLTPTRLTHLYGIRFQIERMAISRLIRHPLIRDITDDLSARLKDQDKLAESKDPNSGVEWYLRTIDELHVEIARQAGLPDPAMLLRSMILQVRIGSRRPLESPKERRVATEQHTEFVARLSRGGIWDRDWEKFIQNHFKTTFARALERHGVSERAEQDRLWDDVVNLFNRFLPPETQTRR